jgi:8-oxo-dGTP pyrophosphatase MutT (NUDIX family)
MTKTLRVVGCIIQKDDKILMLYRSAKETDPSLWGIPAGKVEPGESDIEAVIREIEEETSIKLSPDDLKGLGVLPIQYPDFLVEFPIFHAKLDAEPEILLQPREHIDYQWIKPVDALKSDELMRDVDVIIRKYCLDLVEG